MSECSTRNAEISLRTTLQALEDKVAVGLRLNERRVIFDMLDEPLDITKATKVKTNRA